MKIILVCRSVPYPPRRGASLRLWQLLNGLAKVGTVDVVSFGDREIDAERMPIAASWTHVGDDVPEARVSGLMLLLKLIRPRQYPFENDFCTGELNAQLVSILRGLRPDVVVLSHWKDALPRAIRGHRRLIVDAHNIESSLDGGSRAQRNDGLKARFAKWRFRRRERKLFHAAKSVWTTSEIDAAQVLQLDRKAKVRVVPNAVDTERFRAVLTNRLAGDVCDQGRATGAYKIGYIGTFFYEPNQTAAMRLIDEIFPLIAERLPGSELWLVGKDPTQEMLNASGRDVRVRVTGSVDDTLPYFRDLDVLIVPIVVGSGTRLKILEAFAAGLPVISTAKGAEGIAAVDGQEIIIAESSEALANAAIRILGDRNALCAQITAGSELVERSYSWTSAQRTVSEAVAELMK